jgi:hypothetical protein
MREVKSANRILGMKTKERSHIGGIGIGRKSVNQMYLKEIWYSDTDCIHLA